MSIVSYKNLKKYMKDMLPDDKVKLRLIGSMGVGTGRNFFGEDILDVGVNGLCSGNLTDDSDIDLKDAVECVFTLNHEIAHYNQQHDSDVKSNVIESYLSQLGNQAFYFAWNDGVCNHNRMWHELDADYEAIIATHDEMIKHFDTDDVNECLVDFLKKRYAEKNGQPFILDNVNTVDEILDSFDSYLDSKFNYDSSYNVCFKSNILDDNGRFVGQRIDVLNGLFNYNIEWNNVFVNIRDTANGNDQIRKIACVMDKAYPEYKQKFASGDSVIFDEQDLFGKHLPDVPFNYKISVVTRDLKSRLRDRLYKNANKKSLKIESEVQKDVN